MPIQTITLNLEHKGEYNGGTQYKKNNVVSYNGSSYTAKQDVIGIAPDTLGVNWGVSALGVTPTEQLFVEVTSQSGNIQSISPDKKVLKLDDKTRNTGYRNNAFLMADNQLKTCGLATFNGTNMTRNTPNNAQFDSINQPVIEELVQGTQQTYLLDNQGQVWSNGINTNGCLGHGDTDNRLLFTKIQYFEDNTIQISQIIPNNGSYTGNNRCCYFITTTGLVYSVGYNGYFNLGVGDSTQRNTPVLVSALSGVNIVKIEVSNDRPSVLALDDAGNLYAWGNGANGTLGNGSIANVSTPLITPVLTGVLDMRTANDYSSSTANATSFSIALKTDGTLWATGGNPLGQLGQGNTTQSTVWIQVPGLTNISQIEISGGYYGQVAVIDNTGTMYFWGYNGTGIAGDNTTTTKLSPYIPPVGTGVGELPIQGNVDEIKIVGVYANKMMLVRAGNRVFVSGYFNNGVRSDGLTTATNNFIEAKGIVGDINKLFTRFNSDGLMWWGYVNTAGYVRCCGDNTNGCTGTNAADITDVYILSNVLF